MQATNKGYFLSPVLKVSSGPSKFPLSTRPVRRVRANSFVENAVNRLTTFLAESPLNEGTFVLDRAKTMLLN